MFRNVNSIPGMPGANLMEKDTIYQISEFLEQDGQKPLCSQCYKHMIDHLETEHKEMEEQKGIFSDNLL